MSILAIPGNLALLSVLVWWVWNKNSSLSRKLYFPALTIKIIAGILLGVIHLTYYADSDTFYYFNEGVKASSRFYDSPVTYFTYLGTQTEGYFLGEARVQFFIKLVSIFCLLTANNYWLVTVYFSLFSFFAAWWLTGIVVRFIPSVTVAACIAFFFFPSCIFWSSGILKESVAVVTLYCIGGLFLLYWFDNKLTLMQVMLLLIAVWVGWTLKYYFIGLFIPVLTSALVTRWASQKFRISHIAWEILILVFLLAVASFGAGLLHPNLSVTRVTAVVVENYYAFIRLSAPEDVIHYYRLSPAVDSFLMNAPWALFSGLFRPFIWEAGNLMQVLASIENAVLFALFIFSIQHIHQLKNSSHRHLILAILLYSGLLCIFLALSSPNFGTLARYRIGFLPFLVLLLLHHPFITKIFIRKKLP